MTGTFLYLNLRENRQVENLGRGLHAPQRVDGTMRATARPPNPNLSWADPRLWKGKTPNRCFRFPNFTSRCLPHLSRHKALGARYRGLPQIHQYLSTRRSTWSGGLRSNLAISFVLLSAWKCFCSFELATRDTCYRLSDPTQPTNHY